MLCDIKRAMKISSSSSFCVQTVSLSPGCAPDTHTRTHDAQNARREMHKAVSLPLSKLLISLCFVRVSSLSLSRRESKRQRVKRSSSSSSSSSRRVKPLLLLLLRRRRRRRRRTGSYFHFFAGSFFRLHREREREIHPDVQRVGQKFFFVL